MRLEPLCGHERAPLDAIPPLSLNLLLRGMTVGILLLAAAALCREHSRSIVARLGASFAIGAATATVTAAPGFGALAQSLRAGLSATAAASMFVFWLFTRALLSDAFDLRPWHLLAGVALAALGALDCVANPLARGPLVSATGLALGLMPVCWALLAIVQSLATWRSDLLEGRRQLRMVIVSATAVYTIAQLLAALVSGRDLRLVVGSTWNAAGTAALALYLVWRLLHVDAGELFARDPAPAVVSATPPEPRQLATLERLMTVERIYREPSLTIAALASRMGLPEHRLRKLINQGLGHRNFNAFLNSYRIHDAKQALGDKRLGDLPVMAIAMNAGFQSLGPFNRAFKSETGLTPTEFRRGTLEVLVKAETP